MSRTEEIAASSLYMTPVVYGKEEDMNIDDIHEVRLQVVRNVVGGVILGVGSMGNWYR